MAFSKVTIVFFALVALSLAMPQHRPQRPFGGNFFPQGAQAQAGGFSNTNTGLFGTQGSGVGFGSASGPHAAFATGQASSSSGFGGSNAQGGGTAFGF